MAICLSGMNQDITPASVTISITAQHPLIRLATLIPWKQLESLVIPDLKNTTKKGCWWIGRKLKLRIHLGIYLLQQFYNKTDRQMEYDLKDNAAYQLFCGLGIVDRFHYPDHTKIESFRSRLSPETQRDMVNLITIVATKQGFAFPSKLDVDSTVQEANMAFPSDAQLMIKLAVLTKKIVTYLTTKGKQLLDQTAKKKIHRSSVNLRLLRKIQREYFFLGRYPNSDPALAKFFIQEAIKELYIYTLIELIPIWVQFKRLHCKIINQSPWNIKQSLQKIANYGSYYLYQLGYFIYQGIPVSFPLCFHLEKVASFNKGKLNRQNQYGRAYQLGRIGGNFFFVSKSSNVQMSDKPSLPAVIKEHRNLFGKKMLSSFATDRGYFSNNNKALLVSLKLKRPVAQLKN